MSNAPAISDINCVYPLKLRGFYSVQAIFQCTIFVQNDWLVSSIHNKISDPARVVLRR